MTYQQRQIVNGVAKLFEQISTTVTNCLPDSKGSDITSDVMARVATVSWLKDQQRQNKHRKEVN